MNELKLTDLTKLLVGLGSMNSRLVEVVNLDGSGNVCRDLPRYPLENYAATGQLINGTVPMICGGVKSTAKLYNYCDCYALIDGAWVEVSEHVFLGQKLLKAPWKAKPF